MAAQPTAVGKGTFRRVLGKLILGEKGLLVRLSLTALLGALVALALPYGSRIALDMALPDGSPHLLAVVAVAIVVVAAHQAWFAWVQESTRIALSAAVEEKALASVLRALVRSDLSQLLKRNSGWTTTTLNGASAAVNTYVGSFVTLLTQSLFAVGYLVVLAEASPGMAAVLVVFNLGVTALSYVLARFESSNIREMLERRSVQQELLNVLLTALSSIRGHFATERLGAGWGRTVHGASRSALSVARVSALMTLVQSTGTQIFGAVFLIWAANACFHGELSIGTMVFLLSVSTGLLGAMSALISVWVGFRSLRPHFERVDEVLRGSAGTSRPQSGLMATDDKIIVRDVSFRYAPRARWVVQGQNLEVERGTVHRISSPSGSGKSTLLRMIAGLHHPHSGQIRVFGVEAALARDQVLYVPQHCKLFETSIRENLELLSGATFDRLREVANLTGFSRILATLPMGLETLVSAEGQNLSSGQRQLLVLTAAFASERPVLLLDEATSQVDASARRLCRWDQLLEGRTAIIVEHG